MPTRPSLDDVSAGTELPPLVTRPTKISNFLYGVALWAAHRIHYDKDWAVSEGYRDTLIIGGLTRAYVIRMLVDWAGEPTALRKIALTNRAPVFSEDTLTVQTIVRDKTTVDGHTTLEFDVYVENQEDVKVVVGSATLRLPARSTDG